jgi:hypothetical protein
MSRAENKSVDLASAGLYLDGAPPATGGFAQGFYRIGDAARRHGSPAVPGSRAGGYNMFRTVLVIVLLGTLVALTGCMVPATNTIYAPVSMTRGPLAVGDAAAVKHGKAEATGIILFAFGDASIEAAMSNGNISRISYVDTEELNVLGIYCKKTVIVHGE